MAGNFFCKASSLTKTRGKILIHAIGRRGMGIVHVRNHDLPRRVNYLDTRAISPLVWNQGSGYCYALTTTGAVEGAFRLATGIEVQLSPQPLVDAYGYEGGFEGLDIVVDKGLPPLMKYLLVDKCEYPILQDWVNRGFEMGDDRVYIDEWYEVLPSSKFAFITALSEQPVIVNLYSDFDSFYDYQGGIFYDHQFVGIDHSMLAYAYDLDEGCIWLKNCWGSAWGEYGSIRVSMGLGIGGRMGVCGLYKLSYVPVIKNTFKESQISEMKHKFATFGYIGSEFGDGGGLAFWEKIRRGSSNVTAYSQLDLEKHEQSSKKY